ncbi:TRAP transporter small permease subunit [Oricola thermophila]|uniref:TRAP transporter small permease protein n=2 Tax=Oricola thermophila TaxID=2742145 RepID=A0A6N1VCU8_9HYPH|nr:TRAP transporter small permease subunit [Oricola thermophila]
MKLMVALNRLLDGAERVFLAGANALLMIMLAINIANILSRFVWDKGIIWVFPWTGVLFVWAIFLAFFVMFRKGQDIAIDALTRSFAPAVRAWTDIVISILSIGLLVIILAQVPTLLPKQVGKLDLVGLQRYWLSVPFFVSCLLIALHYVTTIAARIAFLRNGEDGK